MQSGCNDLQILITNYIKIFMKVTFFKFISSNYKARSLLTFLLITQSLGGFSQIQKGQWIIGGNAAFSYYKYYSTRTSAFSISPATGYFFLNRLAGGIRLGYDAEFNSFQSGGRSRESFISLIPFIRYYFLPYEGKVNFFLDGGYGYSWGKDKNFTQPDFKYHSKIISIKTGPAVFLNERTALEITLGYNHSVKGALGDTLGINSFQIGVGFQIHIGKRKN